MAHLHVPASSPSPARARVEGSRATAPHMGNTHAHSSSMGPSPGCATWLSVAFWRKPLHFIAAEESLHGGGGGNVQQRDSASSDGEAPASPREIERTLGLFDLIMIGIGGTVGAGVFATAGLIANVYAGPGAILSWLIAGLGCILSGLSFMELSCLIPSAGSTYAYAYHALGELPAMFAGFLLTLEYGVSSAGGARSWSDKFTNWLYTEWQITGPEWMKPKDSTVDLYAGLLMSACVVVVLCGMQAGKMLVNVVTMTKISVVLFIIIVGFLKYDAENITPFIPEQSTNAAGQVVFGWPGVFLGASASFFGYIGYDEVCCLAGEAKNPTHNIPRAVIGTIVGAAVLSTLATFSLVGMQRYTEIDAGESYGKAFEHAGWSWAATIVSTGEVFTMPITTFIGFLAQPRVQYAMAKDGLLPAVFAKVDSSGNLFQGTLLCGVGVVLIAIFVPFKILWDFISLGILVAFNLTNASLLLVRASRLRDAVGGREREQVFTHLILLFLVSSFLAAFHWQKSVIAPVVITSDNEESATYFQHYLHSWGPPMAGMCSVFAFGAMCGLKYVDVTAASATARSPSEMPNKKKVMTDKNEIILPTFTKHRGEAAAMRRVPTTSDDEEYCDPPEQAELEMGHLRRHKTSASAAARALDLDTATEDETLAEDTDSPRLRSHSSSSSSSSGDEGADRADGADDDDNNGKPLTFQAPWVPFSPCVAIFFNWFLFAQMDASSVGLIALWLLLALAVYVSYSMHHSLARQQLLYRRVSQ